jgi:nucleoid-associated protein YgaU
LHVRFYSPIAVANARNGRFDNPQLAELQSLAIEREAAVAIPASLSARPMARGDGAYFGASGKRQVYMVQEGDSLWSIAREHGATVNQIRAWNNMSSKDRLHVGQRLTIYAPKNDPAADGKPAT